TRPNHIIQFPECPNNSIWQKPWRRSGPCNLYRRLDPTSRTGLFLIRARFRMSETLRIRQSFSETLPSFTARSPLSPRKYLPLWMSDWVCQRIKIQLTSLSILLKPKVMNSTANFDFALSKYTRDFGRTEVISKRLGATTASLTF